MRVRHNSLPQHTTSPEQRGFCAKDPSTPSLIPRLSLSPTNEKANSNRERTDVVQSGGTSAQERETLPHM